MNKEINKIISWIEMNYTRLNYKEELSLVDYIKQLQQENKKYKEVIDKAIEYIEKCLKQTPIENRTKTDDTLDIEYEYILGILRGGII